MSVQSLWTWYVRCYYNDSVQPPKRKGELAIETVHESIHSRDVEIAAAKTRSDIGDITWGRK